MNSPFTPWRAVLAFALLHSSVYAEPSSPPLMGDWLAQQHRFQEAELEYERLALGASSHDRPRWLEKMFRAAESSENAQRTLHIARAWKTQKDTGCYPEVFENRALYTLNNYQSVTTTEMPVSCSRPLIDQDLYLKGLAYAQMKEWSGAQDTFGKISPESSLHAPSQHAIAKMSEGPALRFYKPGLAAGLSAVIPGAGYAYARRPQTALAALSVTGLFGWAAASTVRSGEKGLGALLSFLALGWYSGGIYGSAQAARKANRRTLLDFVAPLEIRF